MVMFALIIVCVNTEPLHNWRRVQRITNFVESLLPFLHPFVSHVRLFTFEDDLRNGLVEVWQYNELTSSIIATNAKITNPIIG